MSEHEYEDNNEYEHHEEEAQSSEHFKLWPFVEMVWKSLICRKNFFSGLLTLSLIGTAVMFMASAFMGLVLGETKMIQAFQDPVSVSFLTQWSKSFDFVPMKLLALLAFPSLPFLSYLYLYALEKNMNSRSDEQSDLFDKFPLHWATFTTVPLMIFVSFSSALVLKLLNFAWPIQTFAFISQFVVSAIAFAIVYKSYTERTVEWSSLLKAAIPAAVTFELSKHAFLGFSFWLMSAPPVAAVFTLANLTFGWNLFTALVFLVGGSLLHVMQYSHNFEELETIQESSHEGLKAMREVSLIALAEATKRFLQHDGASMGVDAEELAEWTHISERRAQHVLDHLEDVGLVKQVTDKYGQQMAILTLSPDMVSLKEIIDSIEQRNTHTSERHSYALWFWDQYCQAIDERFARVSLRDLVEQKDQKFKKVA